MTTSVNLFAELQRCLDASTVAERQGIMTEVYMFARDNLAHLTTGQLADLGMRCDEEVDQRLDAEQEIYEAASDARQPTTD